MNESNNLYLRLELIWWLATVVVVALVLLPVYTALQRLFPFYGVNIVFVAVFITLTRYLFLLKYTFLQGKHYLNLALVFLSIPAVFLLIQEINLFQTYLDENGFLSIVGTLPREQQLSMMQYIRTEMLLFGVGSVIASIVFSLRLVVYLWKGR